MIESLTIAGPIALVRSFSQPPAADLPTPARREPLVAPDPYAPVGPPPSFSVTPMERLFEEMRASLTRPARETARRDAEAGVARSDGAQGGPSTPAAPLPAVFDWREPASRRLDILA